MAQAGTKTFNLSSQAKKLVSEMRGNPNIDFKHDWKMLTVLVGKVISVQLFSMFSNLFNI